MSLSVVSGRFFAPRARAFLLVLASVVLWGMAPIGNRYFIGNNHLAMPGAAYMALRYSIASICFLPGVVRALQSWSARDWLRGAFCGWAGVAGYNLFGSIAARTVSAGMTGLLNSSESLMILLLSCLIVRRAPGARSIFAALLGGGGIVLLATSAGPAEGDVHGILLLLLGAFGWAVYCVAIPPLIKKHGALQSSAVTMFLGTLPLLVAGGPGVGEMMAAMSRQEWGLMLFMGVCISVVPLVAWNKGVAVLGAQNASWFLYLLPLFSAVGGFLLLGEPLTLGELAGGAMILGSVYIAQRRR
ncbi:MAG: DMT family transporter [Rhodospirillales bacterium]|nr:DMT family transporter [Rhodospirillales bacterium]MDE2318070.1 DMT family transporter [Rhodospirillales bacterium]